MMPGKEYASTESERIIPVKKDKRVPTEAVQIIVKIIQGIKMMAKYIGEITASAPTRVARPLPPLNLRNIDQLCPLTAKMAQAICISVPRPKYIGTYTAKAPFEASKRKVATPCHLPTFLYTFEPEFFFHPISSKFFLVDNLVIK